MTASWTSASMPATASLAARARATLAVCPSDVPYRTRTRNMARSLRRRDAAHRVRRNEIALVRVHGQHRTWRRADDTLGDAAHQEMLHGAAPVRAGDDQIDRVRLGVLDDRVREVGAGFNDRHHVEHPPVVVGNERVEVAFRSRFEITL